MANDSRPPQQDRLPIKLIMPKQGAETTVIVTFEQNCPAFALN